LRADALKEEVQINVVSGPSEDGFASVLDQLFLRASRHGLKPLVIAAQIHRMRKARRFAMICHRENTAGRGESIGASKTTSTRLIDFAPLARRVRL
jgi:hypothetical protein